MTMIAVISGPLGTFDMNLENGRPINNRGTNYHDIELVDVAEYCTRKNVTRGSLHNHIIPLDDVGHWFANGFRYQHPTKEKTVKDMYCVIGVKNGYKNPPSRTWFGTLEEAEHYGAECLREAKEGSFIFVVKAVSAVEVEPTKSPTRIMPPEHFFGRL